MKLAEISIARPVFTLMWTLALVVLGGLALSRLGVDLLPDVAFPVVSIVTPYPGASPDEIETHVTRPIEDAIASVGGIEEVRSYSRDSMSTVVIVFKMETDMRQGATDVRDRLATIRGTLPHDIYEPIISRVDPSAQAVVAYAVTGEQEPSELYRYVDKVIKPQLEGVKGVGNVNILGGAAREIRVELNQHELDATHLTLLQVANSIGNASYDVPSGHITGTAQETAVKAVGSFSQARDVEAVVLAAMPDGQQIRVRDVAKVIDDVKEQRTRTRVNGDDCIIIEIQKQSNTNTVAVVDATQKALDGMKQHLPRNTTITKIMDASSFIRNNMHELYEALILGGLLAVLVIYLFMLDWRSTLISAFALPTSVITTFFVLWQLGFTLNVMTMLGLTLAIGLLIDDSVVVRENIYRHLERGADPVTAAKRGTAEIALAVMATTFTIVAVFAPVAFTEGIVGRMFRQFGLTITTAVLVSLLVSFTLDPMLSTQLVQPFAPDHHEQQLAHWFYGPMLRFYTRLERFYRDVLTWTLQHPKWVMSCATLIFCSSLLLTHLMGREFFPRSDQGDFSINLSLPAGTSLQETDRVTQQVETIVRALPEVVHVATTLGPGEEINKAKLRVKALPKHARERSLAEMMEQLRDSLAAIPALTFNMREAGFGGAVEESLSEAPLNLYVQGSNYGELTQAARQAFNLISSMPGVRDVAISYQPGAPEQRWIIDRLTAGDLDVAFSSIAATLRMAISGTTVAKLRDGEESADVRVLLRSSDRDSQSDIGSINIMSNRGQLVPVRDVTHVEKAATPAAIERHNRRRQIAITANVAGRSLGDVIEHLEQRLKTLSVQGDVQFKFAGEAERMQETFANLGLALILAVVFIFCVLASQFESLIHPFTIMLSLPLAVVGALFALFMCGYALGMPALIGIILLLGLVTKNAILLVDAANIGQQRGLTVDDALINAGTTRLRPILMTSAAMVLGMLPTALSRGEGAEFRAPMSIAVIGGVVTSTVLTLLVVPVVYVAMEKLSRSMQRARGRAGIKPSLST